MKGSLPTSPEKAFDVKIFFANSMTIKPEFCIDAIFAGKFGLSSSPRTLYS